MVESAEQTAIHGKHATKQLVDNIHTTTKEVNIFKDIYSLLFKLSNKIQKGWNIRTAPYHLCSNGIILYYILVCSVLDYVYTRWSISVSLAIAVGELSESLRNSVNTALRCKQKPFRRGIISACLNGV